MSGIDFIEIERRIRQQNEAKQQTTEAAGTVKDKASLEEQVAEPSEQESKQESQPEPKQTQQEVKSEPESEQKATNKVKPEANKPTLKSKAKVIRKPKSRSGGIYIRNIPNSLVAETRRLFPQATNNTDAVTAYIAYQAGIKEGLTPTQLELLENVQVEDPIAEQRDRISHIERILATLVNMMRELEIASSYMIFDRLGFRRENPNSPRQTNINEPGMTDMIERIREISQQMRRQENIKKGRPIK